MVSATDLRKSVLGSRMGQSRMGTSLNSNMPALHEHRPMTKMSMIGESYGAEGIKLYTTPNSDHLAQASTLSSASLL